MADKPDHHQKEVAWNGVRFQVPTSWEISSMGRNYLQLEDDDGPVFELKWQPVKGRFSLDAHLKKVATRRRRRKGVQTRACNLPADWAGALERFSVRAFKWEGETLEGQGAVLHCPHCRTAHLLQFLRSDIVGDPSLCSSILASLRDHPPAADNGKVRWAVYDLCADIPGDFVLRDYRFTAGAFSMTFEGRQRSTMTLRRWGPASVVLENSTLRRFVADQYAWAGVLMPSALVQGDDYVHLDGAHSSRPWAQWFRRLQRKPLYHWLHAWHDDKHNRILAVDARGMAPLPRKILEQVSDHYVVV